VGWGGLTCGATMGALDGFSVLSRRRLLKVGLGAGGLLAAGSLGLWGLRGAAPPVAGLRLLTAHEYRTLSKLAEAVLPDGEVFPEGASSVDLARAFDGFLADEPPWNVDDLKRALFLLELGPVVFERRLATFSNLAAAERRAHFERWGTSASETRRQVAVAFRRFLFLVFYDQPPVWKHLGYDGPLIGAAP
jgi:hypothetical protein